MSKGINISHIEDGEYSVEIELDTDAIDVEIASIAVKIADIETQIAELELDIVYVDNEITTITGEISAIDLQLKEKREEIVVVDDRLSEILEEIAVIDVRLLEIIDEIADLDSQMDSKAMLLSAISSSISVIDSQIAALEEEEQTPEVIAQIALLQSQRASLVSQQESVTEEYNTLSAEKGVLEAEQSTIEIEKDVLESEQTTLEAEKVVLETELSDLQDEWNDLQQELTVSFDEKSTLETDKNIEEFDKTALEKHKEFLEDPANTPVNPTEDIWCADLTEDLSGDVGVIEVAGAVGKGLNLQPGYEGNADYGGARDGMLKPAIAISSPGLYWNWAMRDGWQKWKPNYRYGTIAEIYYDTDTCDINLEECESTDTVQDANQDTALAGVPIEYMDCDSAAFNVDDEVIVKFEDNDWADPKVIGFKEEPKACIWEPWDDSDLCKSNDWTYLGFGPDPAVDCPAIPHSQYGGSVSISNGELTLQSLTPGANVSNARLQCNPVGLVASKFGFKVSSVTISSIGCFYFVISNGTSYDFFSLGTNGGINCGDVVSWTPGADMVFDLSFGEDTITLVAIIAIGHSGETTATIDYIDFFK